MRLLSSNSAPRARQPRAGFEPDRRRRCFAAARRGRRVAIARSRTNRDAGEDRRGAIDRLSDRRSPRHLGPSNREGQGPAADRGSQRQRAAGRLRCEIRRDPRPRDRHQRRAVGEGLQVPSERRRRAKLCLGERDLVLAERHRGREVVRVERADQHHGEEPPLAPGQDRLGRVLQIVGGSVVGRVRAERGRRRGDRCSIGRPLLRVLGEHPPDERVERSRRVGPELGDLRRLLEEDFPEDGHDVLAAEGRDAGEALEEHAPERKDVRASVERGPAARLLGRHVAGRPDEHSSGREVQCLSHHPGDAEIEHLDAADVAADQEEVGRLEIAMHDPLRVHRGEDLGDAGEELHALVDGELAPGEEAAEVLALEPFHHEIGQACGRLAVSDVMHDAGVAQTGEDLDLLREPHPVDGVIVEQHLDGDWLPGRPVARPEDLAHPAGARARLDFKSFSDDITHQYCTSLSSALSLVQRSLEAPTPAAFGTVVSQLLGRLEAYSLLPVVDYPRATRAQEMLDTISPKDRE